MIAYVKGTLEEVGNNFVIIDVQGIGYKVFMSDMSLQKICEVGQTIKVHTYYYVREDNISLYGFLSNDDPQPLPRPGFLLRAGGQAYPGGIRR